jgi:hypothetical protein
MAFDFEKARAEVRALDQRHQKRTQSVVERDTAYQIEVADRGGAMMSALTDEAQAAIDRLTKEHRASRAPIVDGHMRLIKHEHERLYQIAAADMRKAGESMKAVLDFEEAMTNYSRAADVTYRPRVADADFAVRVYAFTESSAIRLGLKSAPKAQPAKPRGPLARLDFSWLFSK